MRHLFNFFRFRIEKMKKIFLDTSADHFETKSSFVSIGFFREKNRKIGPKKGTFHEHCVGFCRGFNILQDFFGKL